MKFINKSKNIKFEQLPKLLDKLEVQPVRTWAFIALAILYSLFYLLHLKRSQQQVVLMLADSSKTGTIKPGPMIIWFLESLGEKSSNFLLHLMWLINPCTVNHDPL